MTRVIGDLTARGNDTTIESFLTRDNIQMLLVIGEALGGFLPMMAVGQELAAEKDTDAGTAWEFIKVDD